MSDYHDFEWLADGTVFLDRVTEFHDVQLPVRSPSGSANLYIRATGVAHFDFDPPWEQAPDKWHRGMLGIVAPRASLEPGDALLDRSAVASFRTLTREEGGSTDDWGIALDDVASVSSSAGNLTMTIKAAYYGDAWLPMVSFAINALVYRPRLDNFPQPRERRSDDLFARAWERHG